MSIQAQVHAMASSKPTQLRVIEDSNFLIIDNIQQEKHIRETCSFTKMITTSILCSNIEEPFMCFRKNYRSLIVDFCDVSLDMKALSECESISLIEYEDLVILTENIDRSGIIMKFKIIKDNRVCNSKAPCYLTNRKMELRPIDFRSPLHV